MSRLIDADALWEKMYKYSDNEGAKMPYGDDDSLIHRDSACFLIENAPTIEPERKKGKWTYRNGKPATIGKSYSVICSECKEWSEYCTNFCPNCGAEMRGEQDE